MKSILSRAATIALFLFSSTMSYKVAVINDVHVDLTYSPQSCIPRLAQSLNQQDEQLQLADQTLQQVNSNAPLGRYGCDPPLELTRIFLQKIKATYSDIDFLLVPGDIVDHGDALGGENRSGDYNTLKKTIQSVAHEIASVLPNTYAILGLGNNDPKYHDQGPTLTDRAEYYNFLYDTWIEGIPKNLQIPNLSREKQNILETGSYRVDISHNLSVLAVNTLYFNKENDDTDDGTIPQDILDWMEAQLSDSSRKYVITNHMYAGAKYTGKSKDQFHSHWNKKYFKVLEKYHDRIVIEVGAHDHFADLRYNSFPNGNDKAYYHNFFESPGCTPDKNQNPGIAVFDIDPTSLVPSNLHLIFLPIDQTYGLSSIPEVSSLPFRDYKMTDFGLNKLTPLDLHNFKNKIEADETLAHNYLVTKLGYDYKNSKEVSRAMEILQTDLELLTSKGHAYKYICQMHQNFDDNELDACIEVGNSIEDLFINSENQFLK